MTQTSGNNSPLSSLRRIINADSFWQRTACLIVFGIALITYILTIDMEASYWDCPEYITCASRLEVGHPPGNPFWMLTVRAFLFFFPSHIVALGVNLSSALFSALAAMLLMRLCYVALRFSRVMNSITALLPASAAALIYAFCDSAWFSAVEAEVYAMSAFLSLLSLWLTVRWLAAQRQAERSRLLILLAYIMGLSLGVHQLNLLIIPVIALAICYGLNPAKISFLKAFAAIAAGCAAVVLILFGIMNGSLQMAGNLELIAVNRLGMPIFSGVLIYVGLIIACVLVPYSLSRCQREYGPAILFPLLLLSGIFVFGQHSGTGAIISGIVAATVFYIPRLSRRIIVTASWCILFIVVGYSSFALILIRGYAAPPMNEGAPTDIFALSSYIARDQYGSTPLLYGATPYSRSMLREDWKNGKPSYTRYAIEKDKPRYIPLIPGARLNDSGTLISKEDSAENNRLIQRDAEGYILADYKFHRRLTPELDMWFPRITSKAPAHIESYADWAGMTQENMEQVEISEAIDSLGNPVGKMGADGERRKEISYRPTYLQNLRYFLSYQLSYMYLRYLGWNFIGRQNDIPSTGEIEHGNVITGLPLVDNAMLGDQNLLPPEASTQNKGRNVYFGIPFILGIAGIIILSIKGRRGRRILALTVLLFLMTGAAIVVYLNQTPGEPRERDYSFLISYATFAIWISFPLAVLMKRALSLRRSFHLSSPKGEYASMGLSAAVATFIIAAVPVMLLYENFDDHDRTLRGEPYKLAADMLSAIPPSIIFTQGDNFTFPLWYAQEVERVGKGHSVIDVSYLAVPEYVVNLMKQGNLKFIATPADIAYGAYAFTRIAEDADTTPVALHSALRDLYAHKAGPATLRYSHVLIPNREATGVDTLRLRDFATSSGMIPFKKLMLLDILAANNETGFPRHLRFLNRMRTDLYRPLLPAMRPDTYAFVYASGAPDFLFNRHSEPMPSHPAYPDPLICEQVRHRRGELIATAKRLLPNEPDKASTILANIRDAYPLETIPPGITSIGDSIFYEGLEYGAVLIQMAEMTDNPIFLPEARKSLDMMMRNAKSWETFYRSLPPARRSTLSGDTRRFISIRPRIEKEKARLDSLSSEISARQRALFPEFIR